MGESDHWVCGVFPRTDPLGFPDPQVATDSPRQVFVDFTMPGDGRHEPRLTVYEDGVVTPLAEELTPFRLDFGESKRPASQGGHFQRLADDLDLADLFFHDLAVGLDDELNGFQKVRSCFFQCSALGVGAWQFFDEDDVAFGALSKDIQGMGLSSWRQDGSTPMTSGWRLPPRRPEPLFSPVMPIFELSKESARSSWMALDDLRGGYSTAVSFFSASNTSPRGISNAKDRSTSTSLGPYACVL